jgi:translation initiation factor IF-2
MAAMQKAAEGRATASAAIRAETKAAADYSERAREGREEARELAREERDKASECARVERDVAREQRDHEERGELRKALVAQGGQLIALAAQQAAAAAQQAAAAEQQATTAAAQNAQQATATAQQNAVNAGVMAALQALANSLARGGGAHGKSGPP